MNASKTVLVVGLPLLFLACQEKSTEPAPAAVVTPAAPTAAPAPVPAPAPAPVAAAPAAATGLPTVEDFEQQALDEINPQNLEQELDKLEKEIGQ